MDITIQIKNDKAYPVCSNAKLFAEIAGTETLTSEVRQAILWLGFEIKIISSDKLLDRFRKE
jgi:hypothetical protein